MGFFSFFSVSVRFVCIWACARYIQTSVTIAFRLSDPSRTRSRSEPGSRPSTPPSAASAAAHPEHAAALASADADADNSGAPLTLPAALARSPRLRTLRASLPAVWNPALLRMSKNPVLERIVLTVPRTRTRASPAHPMHVADASADIAEERVSEWDTDDEDAREEVLGWGSGPQLWMMEAKKHARLMELIKAGRWVSALGPSSPSLFCVPMFLPHPLLTLSFFCLFHPPSPLFGLS